MPRIIEVIVSPAGETSIQTKGYTGSECFHASRFIEEALGVKSTDRPTSEFYSSLTQPVEVQQ